MDEFARFACRLADAAREVTGKPLGPNAVRNKGKASEYDPVTSHDVAAEQAMRTLIKAHYPDHAISGEEAGESGNRAAGLCWSLDPIDGTRSFVCGLPSWTTLIALLDGGEPIIGVIDAPRLGERYVGAPGWSILISHEHQVRISTSGCASLAEARFSTTDPFLFRGREVEAVERARKACRLTRFGLDGYAYARVAAGTLDLVVETGLKPHDFNALIPVMRGAGGWIGDWRGGEDFASGAVVAAATEALYRETVECLGVSRDGA